MTGSCEQGNDPSCSIQDEDFLNMGATLGQYPSI
jgi:hypothetical protein